MLLHVEKDNVLEAICAAVGSAGAGGHAVAAWQVLQHHLPLCQQAVLCRKQTKQRLMLKLAAVLLKEARLGLFPCKDLA